MTANVSRQLVTPPRFRLDTSLQLFFDKGYAVHSQTVHVSVLLSSKSAINNADGTALHLFQKTIVTEFSTSTAKAHRSISLFFRKEMICKTSLEVAMHGDSECRAIDVKEGKNHVRRKFLGGKKNHTRRPIYQP